MLKAQHLKIPHTAFVLGKFDAVIFWQAHQNETHKLTGNVLLRTKLGKGLQRWIPVITSLQLKKGCLFKRSSGFVILFRALSTKTDAISIFEMGKFNFEVRENQ